MKEKNILIIGTIPPPIGGVSIHISRLLQSLTQVKYPYNFFDLKRGTFLNFALLFTKSKLIHLHTSNVYLRVLFTFISKLFGKKVILTIHGNLGRFSNYKNYLDNLSVKFATIPVTINNQSFQKGKELNNRCMLISAFIPPLSEENLERELVEKISVLQKTHTGIFCTNAGTLSYDKDGNEIYQVILLIQIFRELKDMALIVSDPSGAYTRHIKSSNEVITDNILFISQPHSFYEVAKLSDIFLRITTTDGDSLSVKEAIYLGKNVIATNVVDRPQGVIIVENNKQAIQTSIQNFKPDNSAKYKLENGAEVLIDLYKTMD